MFAIRMIRNLLLAVAVLAAGPALAQDTKPAAKPDASPTASKPSASHLAAAREVVILSRISLTFEAFIPQIANQIVNTVTRTRPELKKDLEGVLAKIVPQYEKAPQEMVDKTAAIFARVMTEEELKETAAFFKTKAGKKYIEMQPRVIDQMVVTLDDWNRRMSDEILTKVREEMRKKGHDM